MQDGDRRGPHGRPTSHCPCQDRHSGRQHQLGPAAPGLVAGRGLRHILLRDRVQPPGNAGRADIIGHRGDHDDDNDDDDEE